MNNHDNWDDGFLDYMIYQEVTGNNGSSVFNWFSPKG